MKYIRTKYNIELNNEKIERKIIAQADTIEELCDEFVCKSKTSNFWKVSPHLNFEEYDFNNFDYYGCIWLNEWGLKYIAKMNDKGELELL